MPLLIDRRTFLAAPFFVRHLISAPPSGQLRLGAFGAGGMAFVTFDVLLRHPKVKLVCVAEVDSAQLEQLKAKYPDARVPGLAPDARQGEAQSRRRLRGHARPHARAHGHVRHAPGAPGLPAEAHGAQRPRSPHAHRHGAQEESGHPDGHPDSFQPRVQDRRPVDPGWRHRQDQGSAFLGARRSGAIPIRCPSAPTPYPPRSTGITGSVWRNRVPSSRMSIIR